MKKIKSDSKSNLPFSFNSSIKNLEKIETPPILPILWIRYSDGDAIATLALIQLIDSNYWEN